MIVLVALIDSDLDANLKKGGFVPYTRVGANRVLYELLGATRFLCESSQREHRCAPYPARVAA